MLILGQGVKTVKIGKKPLLNPMNFRIPDLKNASSWAENVKNSDFLKNHHSWAGNVSKPFFIKKVSIPKIEL